MGTAKLTTGPSVLAGQLAAYCRERGYPQPAPEYRFDPVRRWRFDFAFPSALTAVEVEGLTGGSGGRHQRRAGYEADCRKYLAAQLAGWVVGRFTYPMVADGLLWAFLDKTLGEK